ncbi:MAG: AMP-binding protein [Crocinitomicaceae bacterium]|nr:AMP-binding protein [Crocinitomicaceae bacterium]
MNLKFITNNEKLKEQVASFITILKDKVTTFTSQTSGSTGKPKTITINKEYAKKSANATLNFLSITKNDTALLCLSIDTIGGKMMVVRAMERNLQLLITTPSSNPLKSINETIDFIALAPIQLHTILNESPEKLKSIRSIIVGGGNISDSTITLLNKYQITVFQTFGMTETISHIALRKVGFEQEECYTTLEGITISENKNQLCIHAPQLGIPTLLTNDLIELKNEKQFKWIGRADYVINSGGIKIQIEELEKELSQKINRPFFITSNKDDKLGQKVVIVFEGKPDNQLNLKTFYSFLKNNYHIPKEIVFAEEFFYTNSAKINRIATLVTLKSEDFKPLL